MEEMTTEIVPFGKYKGKPIEVMAQDRQYVEWVMAQGWSHNYPQLRTLIINNFQEPSETPEHNAIQVLFLEADFCWAFAQAATPGLDGDSLCDKIFVYEPGPNEWSSDVKRFCPELFAGVSVVTRFEQRGADVELEISPHGVDQRVYGFDAFYRIEIKPSMGDDYPAVLRQMQANKTKYLVLGQYTGIGATAAQMNAIFASSDITVVTLTDIHERLVEMQC